MREKQILAKAIEIQETDLNLHTVHSKFGCSQKSSKQGSLYTIDPRTLSCFSGAQVNLDRDEGGRRGGGGGRRDSGPPNI